MCRALLLLVSAMAVCAALGIAMLAGAIAPLTAPPGASVAAVPGAAALGRASSGAGAAAPSIERTLAPAPVVLAGRCVDWDTGEPIAGSQLRVAGGWSHQGDDGGNWRIERRDDSWAIGLRASAPGYLPVERTIELPHRSAVVIPLRRFGRVAGQLLDPAGAPVAGAVVHLQWPARAERSDGWSESYARSCEVGDDGSFAFVDPLPCGPVRVSVEGAPQPLGANTSAIEPRTFLDLRCASVPAAATITGVLLDPDGALVPRALVHARADGRLLASARTDGRGRFRLRAVAAGLPGCALVATCTDRGQVREGRVDGVAWGSADVTLQLSAGAGVALRVTDAATGAPIERYSVQCVRVSGVRSGSSGELQGRGEHADGWMSLPGLADGEHRLVVWPDDARWLPNLPAAFSVDGDGPRSVFVALRRALPCRVLVLGAGDRPIVGARVQLLRPGEHDVVRTHRDLLRNGAGRARLGVRVADAETDRNGVATLRWFDDPSPLLLRIDGAGMAPVEVRDVRLSRAGVVVRASAVGHVDLALEGVAGWRVQATGADGVGSPPAWSAPCVLDADGRAALALPAGQWRLQVVSSADGRRRALSVHERLRVASGVRVRVERDLRGATAPAAWTTRVRFDGEPVRMLELEHGARGRDGQIVGVHVERVGLDRDGRFATAGLPAGLYRLHVPWSCSGQDVRVPVTGWVELAAGDRRADLPIEVATGRVELQLSTASQRPASGGMLVLRGDRGCALVATPDAQGLVRLDRLPVGRYRLSWRDGAEAVDVGAIDVTTSSGAAAAGPRRLSVPGR